MKEFFERWFPRGSGIRNVITLASGTTLGQLSLVLVSPFLTRIYTPEEFGVLAIYSSILGILGSIAGLRYELAIPLPHTNGSGANILVLTLLCILFNTVIVSIFIALFSSQIPLWLNSPAFASWLWLLPLGVLLMGVYQAFNYWAVRLKRFNWIARTKIQQGIGGAFAQLVLGLASVGALGLIMGHIVGQGLGAVELIRKAFKEDTPVWSRIRWQRIKQRARRYKKFPKFHTGASLANTGSTLLPTILFAAFFAPELAGVFMLAHSTLQVPLRLIGNAIGQVFHAKAVDSMRRGNLQHLVVFTFFRLLFFSLIPFLLIIFFAPDIFGYVFGADWREAGIFAQYMAPWLALQFCVSSVGQVVSVVEKQGGLLISQTLFLISRVGIILIGYNQGWEAIELIASFSVVSALLYLGHFFWICTLLNIGINGFLKSFVAGLGLIKR